MKKMHCMALAMALAGGSAVAQTSAQLPATAGGPDFVMASARRASPAQAAAVRGLRDFAARFAGDAGQLPKGFPLDVRDLGELRHAGLGWGFQVYDVSGAALMSGADLESAARPTGIWRYEVVLHDRPVGLLTLARTAHGWEVVSVGGAGLVEDIETVVAAQGSGVRAPQFRYVRVPQATADFIQVKRGAAAAQFAPLRAARGSLKVRASVAGTGGLLDGGELQAQLRQLIARDATH